MKIEIEPHTLLRAEERGTNKEVIYLKENESIIAITVYVYYGKWE